MQIRTGIIAAAGSGTRMLPVTLGYPKELLPIVNQAAIHLIIEEFIAAGIERIVIVTGENSAPLRRMYAPSPPPERGRYRALDHFMDGISKVEIVFKRQRGPYGNGSPLLVARSHIPAGEGFIYAFGDDLVKSATPFTRQLIATHARTGGLVVGTQEVPWEDVSRYGIARVKEGPPPREFLDVVEKPSRAEAPSNLAVFGRFLLSGDIIDILRKTPLGKANELWLTDALREYIRRGGRVDAEAIADGRWLTIGDPVNYLRTVIEYALADAEIRAAVEPHIRALLGGSA
jgi:UTP--glucose-1-phosphate uridylyltransferase